MAVDLDDSISESVSMGVLSTAAKTFDSALSPDTDVDMYGFSVSAGTVVDFDVDTTLNGPGGLGSYLRLFNSLGQVLAANDNGRAPGENTLGFDAYLRFTFVDSGNYYLGVSNANNIIYNPTTGDGDAAGGPHAIGSYRLVVQALPVDNDDALNEATSLGSLTTTAIVRNSTITPDIDVDMFRFTAAAGQVVDFDLDTVANGPGGLGAYLRLFNAQGVQMAANNDGTAPGENTLGFDAYLRHTFAASGTYYLGVSNANNALYDPVTGGGDEEGGLYSIGDYQLIIQALAVDTDDTISEAVTLGAVTTTPILRDASITTDIDVDMFRFTVNSGQVVDFDIDTVLNGPDGLGSYLQLYNQQGQLLASNDDAAAPGELGVGFDAYLRYTFAASGSYYIAVSNFNNKAYDSLIGDKDSAGGFYSIGDYQLSIQTPSPTPNDADDALSEAMVLGTVSTTPLVSNGTISPDVDVDMHRFTVAAGQIVDFDLDTTLNGPGGLGAYLRLFNAQGQQLAFNDNAAAPGENSIGFDSYFRYAFANAGTFYVAVSNANNILYDPLTGSGDTAGGSAATGAYQLFVQALPIDNDDAMNEALSLGSISTVPITRSSTISPDIDVDMFRFTVSAGQVVDFDIDTTANGVGGLGSYLRLFNAQGQQLAANDDDVAPGESVLGFDAYLRFTFLTSGTYYIAVSNSNNKAYDASSGTGDTVGGFHSIGDYQLIVQTPAATPVDNDDAISEAVQLGTISTSPLTATGSISPDVDVDMIRFTVTAGQVVDIDLDTPTNAPGGLGSYLRLFNAQGQELAANDNAAAPGENTVGIDAYLRFNFTTSGIFYLGISNSNNVSYDPLTGTGDTAGGSNSTGTYHLSVQALPVDNDDSFAEATSLGSLTTTPVTRNAAISPDIDVDMYRFTASVGQVIDFDIDTVFNGPGGLGSYLRLFNAQGLQLAFSNDNSAPGENTIGFDAYLRYTFALSGTYYVAVSNANNVLFDPVTGEGDSPGGSYSIGDYQLVIQVLPIDVDDSISEATSLGAITTVPINRGTDISPDIDVDMYRFTVNSGQVVDFDVDTPLNGPDGLAGYLRLFDDQGQQLAFNDNAAAPGEGSVGFDPYLRYTFSVGGTYYVAISNFHNTAYDAVTGNGDTAGGSYSIGAYQLTVQSPSATAPPDFDDALSEAIAIGAVTTAPQTANGIIASDVDVDMFSFTVTAGQVVDIDIDTTLNGPGGLGSYIRLFNAAGLELSLNDDAAAPGEGTIGLDAYLRHTFAAAGTYYVGVSNSGNTSYNAVSGGGDTAGGLNPTGAYLLVVQALPPVLSPSLTLSLSAASIPEIGGQATATLVRSGGDDTVPLTVTILSSDTSSATVPPTVTFAANQTSTSFPIAAVYSSTLGSRQVQVGVTATGYDGFSRSLLITDSDGAFHNSANPPDTNNDGFVSAIDALLVINYLNIFGPGPTPSGSPPPYLDVNSDNFISSIDALLVINALNTQGLGEGDGAALTAPLGFTPVHAPGVEYVARPTSMSLTSRPDMSSVTAEVSVRPQASGISFDSTEQLSASFTRQAESQQLLDGDWNNAVDDLFAAEVDVSLIEF